jgi:heat-inducible transcriptional repressor
MLLETSRVLSRLTQYVSVAATFPRQATKVTSIEFAGITRERILMTVVFANGLVENRILEGRSDLTLGDLHQLSMELTKAAGVHTTRSLARTSAPTFDVALSAWKSLRSVARKASTGKVVSEGTHFLFDQPEFRQDVDALSRIVNALENSSIVHDALDSSYSDSSVTIGKENAAEALQSLSIVVGKFYMSGEEAGAIAVVGPARMRYATAIPLVETAAKALTDALTRLTR